MPQVNTGLLERIVTFYQGARQFALFRLNQTGAAAVRSRLLAGEQPSLPCGALCSLNWTHPWHNKMWSAHLAKKLEKAQRHFRPPDSACAGKL